MSTKRFIPFRIDVSNRIPQPTKAVKPSRALLMQTLETPGGAQIEAPQRFYPKSIESQPSSDVTVVADSLLKRKLVDHTQGAHGSTRKFGQNLRMDAAHSGIELRRGKELTSIAVRLFHMTTETIESVLKDLVSSRHWVQKYRVQHVTDHRTTQLSNEISLTNQQLYHDGQFIAATRKRLAQDESIVTYESHLITADALARLTINIDAIDRITTLYKETVLVASIPVSARIFNRLESSKMRLSIHRKQFIELSRIIAILRDQARSRQLAAGTNLTHAPSAPAPSTTNEGTKIKPRGIFRRKRKPKV